MLFCNEGKVKSDHQDQTDEYLSGCKIKFWRLLDVILLKILNQTTLIFVHYFGITSLLVVAKAFLEVYFLFL